MSKIYTLTSKLGQGYCDDSGARTQSYDCPPHIKYVKLLLYVQSESGMSMKCMREGPYHNEIATFLLKTETLLFYWGRHLQSDKHILMVWSESGMIMKWMGDPNHILQHDPSEKPRDYPTS
jgi:hypothetical protein